MAHRRRASLARGAARRASRRCRWWSRKSQAREAFELTLVENLQREDLESDRGGRGLSAARLGVRLHAGAAGAARRARIARRWPTRCACSSCRRRCATSSPAASCRWATRARCSASSRRRPSSAPRRAWCRSSCRCARPKSWCGASAARSRRKKPSVGAGVDRVDARPRAEAGAARSAPRCAWRRSRRRPARSRSTITRSISSTRFSINYSR